MIIFHEGLPGAGKSYEAMVTRIIPAISKGREVVAYVEGIQHGKIAELCGITEERCRELLITLSRDDMAQWLIHARDNALHVFDEAQNFWGNRAKLSDKETQFVTEHRHRGIDVVLMGQDLRDVHATWRRRVELKLCFLKANGLGLSKRYTVTTYRHLGGDEFARVGLSTGKYDPKYFGTYASHVSDDTNTDVYTDKRAQVWHHPGFKYGAPIMLVAALWGGHTMWGFFHGGAVKVQEHRAELAKGPAAPVAFSAPRSAASAASVPAVVVSEKDLRTPQEKYLADLSSKYRSRLAGVIKRPDRFDGYVEWIDGGEHVMDRISMESLRQMGVSLLLSDGFVRMQLGAWAEIATSWPVEVDARISDDRLEAMRQDAAAGDGGQAGSFVGGQGSGQPRQPRNAPGAGVQQQVAYQVPPGAIDDGPPTSPRVRR